MDRLDELSILVTVIDEGSLAAAARRLHRSAPAITRALNALEDRVGARLVERTTRRLSPTEQGLYLVERARSLLADYDTATHNAAVEPLRGLVRVTAPVQFGRRHVASLVNSFLDAYPALQVELVLNDRNLDLLDEGLDVAVRIGALPDSSLLARRVGEVTQVLVASPAYLAQRGTPAKPGDLAGHDTIFSSLRSRPREWRFETARRDTIVRLSPRLLVNEVEAQLAAVRAGRGIARLLSYQVAPDLDAGLLVRLLAEYEPPPLPVQLVALGSRHMSPKVRAFFDHVAQGLLALPVIHRDGRGQVHR
jgi:DNA-binding transcriptional LysR family regulator